MSKLLKISIPVLVAVLILVIGTGLVVAKERDTSVLNCPYASYDAYPVCSQCPGQQYTDCPCAGNGGGSVGCRGNGFGQGEWADENDASYQPPCHRFGR